MSHETNNLYDFENFRLDLVEKVLLRDGEFIPITPKVFETLKILVENAGRLIEKDELMQKLWHEQFVEESNLTFNIKMLRKALGDSASKPRFIETVPKRGYRFIAEVHKKAEEPIAERIDLQIPQTEPAKNKRFLIFPAALAMTVLFFGFWYTRSGNLNSDVPILSSPFALEALTTNGSTRHAVVSPDGKNLVYTQGKDNENQSVWLRQLESGNNVEIIPPSADFYYGLALSPDGNSLYFVRHPRLGEGRFDIFRVSIFGGIPQKLLSQTEGWISISPNGEHISFVRCPGRGDENCSLFIADAASGQNERKLLSRPRPFRLADNRFSPDGRSIAFAVGQSETAANDFGLMEVEVESGSERALTGEKFFNIRSMAWLPGGKGLLFTASRNSMRNYRIWQLSRVSGEVLPLTKDSESYSHLSLDGQSRVLVSTQVKEDFRLKAFEMEAPSTDRILANAGSVSYAAKGRIVFSSIMSGNDEIWSINNDGSGQRQLTNSSADEHTPLASPVDDSIYFTSNRTGAFQIWKMNADGSDQTRITRSEGGAPLLVSTDGRWLYFHHSLHKTLWRVPAEGGEEQLVLDKRKHQIAVSPDGLQAAFPEKQGAEIVLMIASLADGQTSRIFKLAVPQSELSALRWSANGENILYVAGPGEYENKTLWRQSFDAGPPVKIADLGTERLYNHCLALAPDGKSFAITHGGWQHDAVLLTGLK